MFPIKAWTVERVYQVALHNGQDMTKVRHVVLTIFSGGVEQFGLPDCCSASMTQGKRYGAIAMCAQTSLRGDSRFVSVLYINTDPYQLADGSGSLRV